MSWDIKTSIEENLDKVVSEVNASLLKIPIPEGGCPDHHLRSLQYFLVTKQKGQFKFHSAFLYLLWEAVDTLNTAIILSLAHRYNSARVLFRLALESAIRGAFYNAISQRKYQNQKSSIDEEIKIDFDGVRKKTSFRKELFLPEMKAFEHIQKSGSFYILTLIQPYQKDWKKRNLLPTVRDMVNDLSEWGILSGSLGEESNYFYGDLSQSVHLTIESTHIGFRLRSGLNPFEDPKYIQEEYEECMEELEWMMEILTTLTMNVLKDNISFKEFKKGLGRALENMELKDEELVYFRKSAEGYLSNSSTR
jgi:hypothetical protein